MISQIKANVNLSEKFLLTPQFREVVSLLMYKLLLLAAPHCVLKSYVYFCLIFFPTNYLEY